MRRLPRILAILTGVIAPLMLIAVWPSPSLPVRHVPPSSPSQIDGATIIDTVSGTLLKGMSVLMDQG
uniref:hypothetical protein n=1 Tax=Niveispirillum sp. TaxID=1917217 RepID=UPI001B4A7DDE